MRIIAITSGCLGEYEYIRTNAPDELIHKQLSDTVRKEEAGEIIEDAYKMLIDAGDIVELASSHMDSKEEPEADAYFDYYDY